MLAQFFPPDVGGEERHVLNLSNALAARGNDVHVGTQLLPGQEPAETLASGVVVHRLRSTAQRLAILHSDTGRPHHPPVPDPGLTTALSQLIADVRPAVVHAHNWIINSAVALRRARPRYGGFALVLTLHDYSHVCATQRSMRAGVPCPGPRIARCLTCACAHYGPLIGLPTAAAVPVMRWWKNRALDHIVCVSRAVLERNAIARSGVPFSVIPNFIPDELIGASPSAEWPLAAPAGATIPPGEFMLFFGDLTREKGAPTIIEAYQRLGITHPALLMIGRRGPDIPDPLPDGVIVENPWPHEAIMDSVRRCLMAILPPTWPDPCPTTVLEAMACGRPVVTTAMGGVVDMVDHGVEGIVVRPGNAADLAAAMRRLLDDDALRERLGAAGLRRVGQFTASTVAGEIERVYEEVVSPR